MRKALQFSAGVALMVLALLMVGFVATQYWLPDRVAAQAQAAGARHLTERVRLSPLPEVPTAAAEPAAAREARSKRAASPPARPEPAPRPKLVAESPPEEGEAFARMVIPAIDVDVVVFSGVDVATLRLGPGHMPWTPLPGQPGNATVSGHRTTYGAPFNRIDELTVGDRIEVETLIGRHVYEVRQSIIVEPDDVWVADPLPGAWLTLTTCHPEHSSRQRFVVHAALVAGPNLAYVDNVAGSSPALAAPR